MKFIGLDLIVVATIVYYTGVNIARVTMNQGLLDTPIQMNLWFFIVYVVFRIGLEFGYKAVFEDR